MISTENNSMVSTKMKILAIDDKQDHLVSLKAILDDLVPGIRVIMATNGRKGIALAMMENPDVILLEIGMTGMDGFEVCRQLKDDNTLSMIPVVFLTSLKTDRNSVIKALEAGAEVLLSKPIDEMHMVTLLHSMVRIKESNVRKQKEQERLSDLIQQRTTKLKQESEQRTKAEETLVVTNLKLRKSQSALLNILEDLKQQNIARKQSEERLRELTTHIQEVREEERAEIAQNLHDDLGQKLTALNIDLAWLAARVPVDFPELSDKIDTMHELILDTASRIKEISSKLRPSILDDLGIAAAISWQANEFSNRTDIPCKVSIIPESLTMPSNTATQVFRIVQESLTNIMRHAEASNVVISLIEKQKKWRLRIKDNGDGFMEEELGDKKSFGLSGMEERTKLCNGTFSIKSKPGSGVEIIVEIPISGQ
ncbi:MAG: response regulator [Bacteroidales bacterium]|nr:response regulator [Bacteroidales bacterium]